MMIVKYHRWMFNQNSLYKIKKDRSYKENSIIFWVKILVIVKVFNDFN